MIVLDTNIISEMMKSAPDMHVIHWLNNQEVTDLHITCISIAEILYGIRALTKGKRRDQLGEAFDQVIKSAFFHRILPFDEAAAINYGNMMALAKSRGRPMSILDGQIAAITKAHHATLATRNIRDFKNCEIAVSNPFG